MNVKIFIIALIAIVLACVVWFFMSRPETVLAPQTTKEEDLQNEMPVENEQQSGDEEVDNTNSDLIEVDSPQTGDTISSPVTVSGQARGTWFFEASAPVQVTNWDGLIIGEGIITADGDWMTEDFVPFSGTITYTQDPNAYSATGTVIFMRDNPSGLPENDAAYEVTVQLQ